MVTLRFIISFHLNVKDLREFFVFWLYNFYETVLFEIFKMRYINEWLKKIMKTQNTAYVSANHPTSVRYPHHTLCSIFRSFLDFVVLFRYKLNAIKLSHRVCNSFPQHNILQEKKQA